ncbi:hypothetical protein ART_0943 [Arthrobacter sp. PAMC 25486]|uniref:DUF5129 domain-containing protein n=1 Tax=Arthrobacter sp. PAMC 25486 TaxID=1494608 RepID=UPI0005359D2A|nr:DUF5129 domain-containing protein [Arthrobacter sp. PAMC 25486]AIY00542.1 hypothetical protein ART_0943 [Arthrobacter sp. PAMC 25486]
MTLPLIRARKKPHFGLPWLAMLLGLSTLIFAFQGVKAVTASPEAQLEVVVEGRHSLNISQASVDAVLAEPIKTWKPLRLRVVDRLLSSDERQGRVELDADVILTTAIVKDTSVDNKSEYRYIGAGIYPADPDRHRNSENRSAINDGYMDNVGIGHGPKAIVAAAQRAADVLDKGPLRSPLFWLAGTVTGLALTIISLAFSLSRRKRRELVFRRLTAAQRKLAGVVLELEALEVTYHATPAEHRTPGFIYTWVRIRNVSLELARTEDAAMEAVYTSSTALNPETADLLEKFEHEAQRLATMADALMGAGSVLGMLAGSQGVLDRLAAPMTFSARELLTRLGNRPAGLVSVRRVKRFERALHALLAVLTGDRADNRHIEAWRTAEIELGRCAASINRSLRQTQQGRAGAVQTTREDVSALRSGLGLSPAGSQRTLQALDEANAAAHALFGPLPGTNDAAPVVLREFSWIDILPKFSWRVFLPRPSTDAPWVVGCFAVVIISLVVSGIVVAKVPQRPGWQLTGTHALQSLEFDGDTSSLDEELIRAQLSDIFPPDLKIIVAMRSAVDYLHIDPESLTIEGQLADKQDPQVGLDAMWRVKGEFPELLDEATGELKPDRTILPVWRLDNGTFSVPNPIAGVVQMGGYPGIGDATWNYGRYFFYKSGDYSVIGAVKDLGRGLQANNYVEPEMNRFWVFVLLALTIGLGLLTLAMVISYGGVISMRLGRFGRSAGTLKQLRTELDTLTLGLDDSRINAVAVLGRGKGAAPAESDQRIFESALAMAWRMVDDLAARPLSQRLDAEYVAQVAKLERLIFTLGMRDHDVQKRTRKLLDATLGNK